MTEIGWLKINRKTIPFHMVKGEVTLIPVPLDSCASLFPHDVEHKEIISGITTSNRKISFIGCKYNNLSLGYKAFAWSSSNMGDSTNLNYFDAIRFTGKVINVFSGPGTTFLSEESYDISKRMLSLTPKPWEQINKEFMVKIGQNEATIRVYYHITHNLKFEETSLGKAIPFFDIIFSKKVQLKSIMELYLKVYDFFVFLNFKRNIIFDEISLLNKSGNGLSTLAYVKVNNDISTLPYAGLGCSTITLPDCEEQFSNLFYNISMRRKNRIFDNFYIPESFESDKYISYERMMEISKEGEYRYLQQIPPGYKDEANKIGLQKYGDLYLWNQILDYATKKQKNFILVTNDVKVDWFEEDKTTPRFEILKEFNGKSNKSIWLLSMKSFIWKINSLLDEQLTETILADIDSVQESKANIIQNVNLSMELFQDVFDYFLDEKLYLMDIIPQNEVIRLFNYPQLYEAENEEGKKYRIVGTLLGGSNYASILHGMTNAFEIKKFYSANKEHYIYFNFVVAKNKGIADKCLEHLSKNKVKKMFGDRSIRTIICYIEEEKIHIAKTNFLDF